MGSLLSDHLVRIFVVLQSSVIFLIWIPQVLFIHGLEVEVVIILNAVLIVFYVIIPGMIHGSLLVVLLFLEWFLIIVLFCSHFSANQSFVGGPKPFKFQSMWLLHPSFQELVATCWGSTMPVGCPMYVTMQKLKTLKFCLKNWNYNVFGNVHRQLESARVKLGDI